MEDQTSAAGARGGPATRRHGHRSWRFAPRVAVVSLVALSLLLYGLPSLLGHPVVPGDDYLQNLPLRELVGADLRRGILPVFDPYLWSGAPLLAGWNAGAAYPLTWLFAVLPASAAWAVNLSAAAAVAGVGTFAFLRASRLGVAASWIGALTFAFGGGMAAQVSHLGFVVGMSWVPVAMLAVLRLSEAGARDLARWAAWTGVLALSLGLMVLAGEPRAVADAAVVLLPYALWRAWRTGRPGRLAASAGMLSGAVLGAAVGAVQLVPGLAAVATSQRGATSAFLFSAGSLPARWLVLLGVPDLLGGSGSFGQPTFFASYSLMEVTGYVGVLGVVAAGALLWPVVGATRRSVGRPRLVDSPVVELAPWYVAAALGIALALGSHEPLWHLLAGVPLLGGLRLPSRAILSTDLALAVILAYWAEGWLTTGLAVPAPALAGRPRRVDAARVGGTAVAACVAGVVVVALADPSGVAAWLGAGAGAGAGRELLAEGPSLAPFLVLALVAVLLVWGGPRIGHRARAVVLPLVIGVDLVVFAVTSVVAVDAGGAAASPAATTHAAGAAVPTTTPATPATRPRPISDLGFRGRFAVYDPGLLGPLRALEVPDTSAVARTWSVQGYGSIVNGRYARATGTHGLSGQGQDVFSPAAARDGVLDQLDTTDVLAPAAYFSSPAPSGAPLDAAGPGVRHLGAHDPARWLIGEQLAVSELSLAVRPAAAGGAGPSPSAWLRVGLRTPSGRIRWAGRLRWSARRTGSTPAGTLHAAWPEPTPATEVVVESAGATGARASASLGPPTITAGTTDLSLDGVLQAGLVPPHWGYAGHDGSFGIFVDHRALAPLRLLALRGIPLGTAASVQRVAGPALEPAAARVVSGHGALVVRAVADVPGWSATWVPSTGHGSAPLAVRSVGVDQGVAVPAGSGTVRWRYRVPGLALGGVASASGAAVVLALLVAAAFLGRGRPRGRRPRHGVAVGGGPSLQLQRAQVDGLRVPTGSSRRA